MRECAEKRSDCLVQRREEIGRWEMDTIVGNQGRECVLSLVERVTGCVLIGKLRSRTVAATNGRVMQPDPLAPTPFYV